MNTDEAYHTEFFFDDKGNAVEKDKASMMKITIYDSYDIPYRTFYLKLKK